jgi:hypothetical protein
MYNALFPLDASELPSLVQHAIEEQENFQTYHVIADYGGHTSLTSDKVAPVVGQLFNAFPSMVRMACVQLL